LFFYETESMRWGFDPADRGCSHVAFVEVGGERLTCTPPPVASPVLETFRACSLSFDEQLDLPSWEDLVLEKVGGELSDAQRNAYFDVCQSLEPTTYHHILGHAQLIQSDMRLECQLASNGVGEGILDPRAEALRPGAIDWALLLQIDTDEEGPGWMWGDVGRLYFWLRTQDLAARRFDQAWLVLQCC
jgi:uncharacterized protein YwqG